MRTTAIAKLKAQLSRYLRLVKTGEEVLITERDVPVAKLVPVGEQSADLQSLRDLERQGLLKVGTGRLPKNFWKLPRGKDPSAAVRRGASEERDRGW
ncbi:MAG: type II toxin-antitoxin system prevent-host-death family antitoxin [Planctomycetes bacterium]|jgi:prevent-host-death family protein|nr:type II toxin-antitoxin system prevent-host-death family antitoxin [Planctomycetota bacterium]